MISPELKEETNSNRVSIKFLKKGTTVITGGQNKGVITGHKTRDAVQIQLENGEYDWISNLATVEQI